MELVKKSETTNDITLGWEPPVGVEWYLFFAGGKRVSNSAPIDKNGNVKNTVKFSKTPLPQEVVAIIRRNGAMSVDVGVWNYTSVPPLPPPTSGMPARDLTAWVAQPSIKNLSVQTVSLSSWDGNPRAGVLLKVIGAGSVSSSQGARLCSWKGPFAAVQLDPGARFGYEVGMSLSAGAGRKDLAIFGGLLGDHAGYGIRFSAANRIQWWSGIIRNCGRTGLLVHGNVGNCDGLDLAFHITNCGLDVQADPHSEKGTGLHAAYLADTGGLISNGKYWFVVRDQNYGAAVQLGPALNGSQIWMDAERVNFRAQSQVGGNALQWWGGRNNIVEYVRGVDLAGRLSETDGGAGSGNKILIGRYRDVCQNPRLSKTVVANGVPCEDLKMI